MDAKEEEEGDEGARMHVYVEDRDGMKETCMQDASACRILACEMMKIHYCIIHGCVFG